MKEQVLKGLKQAEEILKSLQARIKKISTGKEAPENLADLFEQWNQALYKLEGLREIAGSDKALSPSLKKALLNALEKLGKNRISKELIEKGKWQAILNQLSEQKRIVRALKKDLAFRWNKPLEVKILGIGEITTTIELVGDGAPRRKNPRKSGHISLAVKKAPSFPSRESAEAYQRLCYEYEDFLSEKLGIQTPYAQHSLIAGREGRWLVYNLQEKLPQKSIACLIIQVAEQNLIEELFLRLLNELKKVFFWNLEHPEYQIGLDAQISNWALLEFRPEKTRLEECEPLLYIDTSTPMIRKHGKEQLDTEVFIKSIPLILRPIIRWTLLQEVLDRYYRPRDVILDLIASFITHHRPDLVKRMVELANQWMGSELKELNLAPFHPGQIFRYNQQDVLIWKFFRQMKRMDKFITEKILGRTYEQRLPSGSPKNWENLVGAGGKGLTLPKEWEELARSQKARKEKAEFNQFETSRKLVNTQKDV